MKQDALACRFAEEILFEHFSDIFILIVMEMISTMLQSIGIALFP